MTRFSHQLSPVDFKPELLELFTNADMGQEKFFCICKLISDCQTTKPEQK